MCLQVTGSNPGNTDRDDASSHNDDTGREIGIVVGISVVVLIIIAGEFGPFLFHQSKDLSFFTSHSDCCSGILQITRQ